MGLKRRSKANAEFNMSSLTDIIFLLLIFFMLTSSLVNPTAINLKAPGNSKSKAISSKKPITVKVDENETIRFNSKSIAKVELEDKLRSAVASDSRPAEEITVILNMHEDVGAQTLVEVVDVFNTVGVKMILATKVSE